MLDFLPLEKTQAAIHPIRQASLKQRMLQHPRLGVGTIQHRHIGQCMAVAAQRAHFVDNKLGFVAVGPAAIQANRLACARVRPQVFAQPAIVMLDQRIGGVENIAAGAVVLLQLDRLGHLKIGHQPAHIAHFGTPEGINRLVIVPHGKHAGVRAGKQGKPGILQLVGVLELVHQNMRKPCPIMLTQGFVAAEQLVAAQQQLGKVHHAFAPALGVVGGVKFSQLGIEGIMGLQRLGAQALVLVAVDERLHLAWRKFLVRHLQGFHQPLDRRQLVLHVEDGKGLRQAGIAPVGAQKTVGQAVKGANPHAARIDRQHDRQAGVHFPGSFVGEGHRQNIGRHGALPGNQPGNPRG